MAKNIGFKINLSIDGKDVVIDCRKGVQDLGRALGTIPDKAQASRNAIMGFAAATQVVQNTYSGFQQLTGIMEGFIQKSNAAAESQTKLTTVMQQRMNASVQDVKSINDMIAAQTKLGVVGGTVQRSGMQQLATFTAHRQTLETLLPAMNNLLVQQNGLNSTSEAAVGVANLMGKALMGNVGALTRVGITLTDHQKELIKTGDEYTRANTLAEAITQNVGNMNAEMAKTDAGKAKQATNAFAALQTQIGALLSPYQTFITQLGQIGFAVSGVSQLVIAIRSLGITTTVTSAISKIFSDDLFIMQLAMGGASTAATVAAGALTALRVAIRGVLIATGVGIVIALLTEVIGALIPSLGDATKSTDELTAAQQRQTDSSNNNARALEGQSSAAQRMAEHNASAAEKVGSAADNLVAKYRGLQNQWKVLRSDHERNQWIKSNQSAFNELGISVNNVNDAYNYFVKNSSNVVAALNAIAEARAWDTIYQEDLVALHKRERETNTVEGGGYYTKAHEGESVSSFKPHGYIGSKEREEDINSQRSGANAALALRGLREGRDYTWKFDIRKGTYSANLTKSGVVAENKARGSEALQKRIENLAPERKYVQESQQKAQESYQTALGLASAAGVDMEGRNARGTSGGSGTGGNTGRGTTSTPADKPLTWIENPKDRTDYEQNSKYLQQEIDKLDAANDADAARIKMLQEKKADVDEIIDKYNELEKVEAQKPKDDAVAVADKFEAGSLADYEAQLQRVNDDLRNRNVSGMELLALLRQQAALQSTVNRMQLQRGQGQADEEANPYDAQIEAVRQERDRIYDMFDDDIELDVDIKLQGDIDKLDKQLGDLIRKKRQWDRQNGKKTKDGGWESTTEQIEKLGSAAQNMGNAFSQMGDDTTASVMQVVAATASATAEIIPQIMALIGAKEGEALASGTAEGAKVPFPGNIAAIATIVASIMGVIATIGSVTGGFATGGIVPGTSYRGDKLTARVNSGEMILTARQQARLFQIADGSLLPRVAYPSVGFAGSPSVNTSGFAGGGMLPTDKILFRLKGRDVVAMIANETRVGGKIGRRSNIKI